MFFEKPFEKNGFLKKILYIIILGWARPSQLGRYQPNEFGLFCIFFCLGQTGPTIWTGLTLVQPKFKS